MREVNVRWMRILFAVVAAVLFVSLIVYEDPARLPNEPFDPFHPYAVRDRLWFDDPITRTEWVAELNYLSVMTYVAAGFGLRGRASLRLVATVLAVAGAAGAVAAGGIFYLAATDRASFPLGSGGILTVLSCHGAGLAGLGAAWFRLRAAALPG